MDSVDQPRRTGRVSVPSAKALIGDGTECRKRKNFDPSSGDEDFAESSDEDGDEDEQDQDEDQDVDPEVRALGPNGGGF